MVIPEPCSPTPRPTELGGRAELSVCTTPLNEFDAVVHRVDRNRIRIDLYLDDTEAIDLAAELYQSAADADEGVYKSRRSITLPIDDLLARRFARQLEEVAWLR